MTAWSIRERKITEHSSFEEGCRILITQDSIEELEDTFEWEVAHQAGAFLFAGSASSLKEAKEKALEAIPKLLKQREDFFAKGKQEAANEIASFLYPSEKFVNNQSF